MNRVESPSINQGKETSVFVFVTTEFGEFRGSLYELRVDQGIVKGGREALLNPVARFFHDGYNGPDFYDIGAVCIDHKLYLLLSYVVHDDDADDHELTSTSKCDLQNAFCYDLKTKELLKLNPSRADKKKGIVIYAYEKIYFLLDTGCNPYIMTDSFEVYDPNTDSWESLQPFPYPQTRTRITGHAVYEGCIFLSIFDHNRYSVMVYHVGSNCWEPVCVENGAEISWSGRAVVLNHTVYALDLFPGLVIAFSVRMDQTDEGHMSFTFSTPSEFSVLEIKIPQTFDMTTQYLTHLGDLQFCVVTSGFNYDFIDQQPVSITTFRIEEGNIKVLDSTRLDFDTAGSRFSLSLCFPVECEDIGRNGDNTILMNQRNQEEGTTVMHVEGTDRSCSSGLNERSSTTPPPGRMWSWVVKKAKSLWGLS